MSENIPDASQMGARAAESVIAQIRQAFDDVGATLEFRVRCLMALATFKGCKAFSYEGEIIYSKPLDFPDVQIRAIHEMNLMDGSHAPSKQEISGPSGGVIQFSDLERANRLRYLIEKAMERQKAAESEGK